ncbi:MAG TPA: HD domain-containing protein [Candidatus Nanopelagicales bacterium]|nr:HD domain-containing protein [Candidatus Nanopelagicales bacterium]
MRLADVPHPGTAVCSLALETVREFSSPALVNHCRRSYVWAAAYAVEHGIAVDAELLYVAAMLHDIGLVEAFDNHEVPFEIAGGHVAWVFAAGAGWPRDRRRRTAEIIDRHMWPSVDVAEDPEGHLLEIATGLDISGSHPEWWDAALRAETVAEIPRLDLAEQFTSCFQAEAARKPDSAAARAMADGIAGRIATNPLDH